MPITPTMIAALMAGAGQVASTAETLAPSPYHKRNRAKRDALLRRQRQGQLGLTGKEQASIERQMAAGADVAARQAQAERNRLLAGSGGVMGGQALEQATAAQQQQLQQQSDISTAILEADLAEKERELDELAFREAVAEERRLELIGAAAEVPKQQLEARTAQEAQEAAMRALGGQNIPVATESSPLAVEAMARRASDVDDAAATVASLFDAAQEAEATGNFAAPIQSEVARQFAMSPQEVDSLLQDAQGNPEIASMIALILNRGQ